MTKRKPPTAKIKSKSKLLNLLLMETNQVDHPLKFINQIANEIQNEKISHTLFLVFTKNKQYWQTELRKPEVKKAVKEKRQIPFNPETYNDFVFPYLKIIVEQLKPQLQNYTSNLESSEQVQIYINQQLAFLTNYLNENNNSYYKESFKGSGNPQKASLMIALNAILSDIKKDYKEYLINIPKDVKRNIQLTPTTFEQLFKITGNAEICLSVLKMLEPPVIDSDNNYIGKNKGIIPLWIKILKSQSIIKHCKDNVYKDILNSKIKGLNLSKDASEFRKQYARLNKNNTELDIKTLLSKSELLNI